MILVALSHSRLYEHESGSLGFELMDWNEWDLFGLGMDLDGA